MRIHLFWFLLLSSLPAMAAEARGRAGSCQPGCPSGQRLCTHADGSQRCFDLESDERHCGRCGNACRHQERCHHGRCTWDCPSGQTFCPQRRDGSPGCTDARSDRFNCGRCGNGCRQQERCDDGRCVGGDDRDRCDRGLSSCIGPDGRQRCTDTRTDERNCGRCGNACRRQESCSDGRCTWDCPSGHTFCPQRRDGSPGCIDARTDRFNCGRCGNSCRQQERCDDGRCVGGDDRDRCDRGQTMCTAPDGRQRCTDTRTDERNCGACGNACRQQERCDDGRCRWDCPSGQMFCPQLRDGSAGCTDTRTDRFNCGRCGNACPSPQPNCRDGRCS